MNRGKWNVSIILEAIQNRKEVYNNRSGTRNITLFEISITNIGMIIGCNFSSIVFFLLSPLFLENYQETCSEWKSSHQCNEYQIWRFSASNESSTSNRISRVFTTIATHQPTQNRIKQKHINWYWEFYKLIGKTNAERQGVYSLFA